MQRRMRSIEHLADLLSDIKNNNIIAAMRNEAARTCTAGFS